MNNMFMDSSIVRNPSRRDRLAAIGAVTVGSSQLEVETMDLYAALLQSPWGMVVASGMGFDQLRQGCEALISRVEWAMFRDEITGALAAGKDLDDQRSSIVHGLWVFTDVGDDLEALPTLRFRKHGKVHGQEWPNESILNLAEQLLNLAERVEEITARVRAYAPGDPPPVPAP